MAILNNSNIEDTPYIESVEGTALIGQSSEIIVSGGNFTPYSKILCNAGAISNIKRSPDKIIFNLLASSTGSFPVEIKNGDFSSNTWNSSYTPLIIARNSLNTTSGWLDFRTANSANFGNITSHINQNLSSKTFANSGFALDPTRGLIFNGTGTTSSYNNYIQFNSYSFPLEEVKIEYLISYTITDFSRMRSCIGDLSYNIPENSIDLISSTINCGYRFGEQALSLCTANIRADSSFPANSNIYIKICWDFISKRIKIYKLSELNFDSGALKFEFPINLFSNGIPSRTIMPTAGVPLFQFSNSGSLSSVIAMKID